MPAFSPEQDAALKAVADWMKEKPGRGRAPLIFRLFGYAGTGKTTLAKHIAENADGKVLFAAFTGKAAMVMRSKGCHGATTIHSLIYRPLESSTETPSFELWDGAPASEAKLIIIDECSMVDAELGRDLMSFGVPVLVLGDPAQLPPIQGGGYFTETEPDAMLTEVHRQARESGEEVPEFVLWDEAPASEAKLIIIDECSMVDAELGRDLMSFGVPVLVLGDPAQLPPIQGGGFFTEAEPDAMLTEVHRQAFDNPIVRLSMDVRAGERPQPGAYGDTQVVRRDELDPQRVLEADQVLVGRNNTRRAYNTRMRERRGFEGAFPSAGDKLVCLRNNRKKGLFNGSLWSVKQAPTTRKQILKMRLLPEDFGSRTVSVSVRPECFTGAIEKLDWQQRKRYEEFDFGYVLTVHKSQGSQWDDVVLFDESFAFPDSRERWLYTGITRAAQKLTLVI